MEIFSYLEKATGVENLSEKPWTEVVNNVILPKLAGRAEYRNRIYPEFMKFLALYAKEAYVKNIYLGEIMLERFCTRMTKLRHSRHSPKPIVNTPRKITA